MWSSWLRLYGTALTPVAHPLGGEASLLVCLYRDGLLQAVHHFKRSARLHNVRKTLLPDSSLPGRYNPGRAQRQKSPASNPTGLRMRHHPHGSAAPQQDSAAVDPSQQAVAIPVALPEAREKLQRSCHQRHRATQSVQRKRYAPVNEVVDLRGKRHVCQQVTKRFQPIHKREDCGGLGRRLTLIYSRVD